MLNIERSICIQRLLPTSPRVLAVIAAVLLLMAALLPVVVLSFHVLGDEDGSARWNGILVTGSPGWWAVLAFAAAAAARFIPRLGPFRRWIDLAALALLAAATAWAFYGGRLSPVLRPSAGLAGEEVTRTVARPDLGCLFALLAPAALLLARRREAASPTPPPPAPRPPTPPGSLAAAALGAVVGLLPIYPAAMLAILSGGMGHGHYVAARALFPVPMLLTAATGGEIGIVVIALALLQFLAYGAALGWGLATGAWRPAAMLAATHGLTALLVFSGVLPNFD